MTEITEIIIDEEFSNLLPVLDEDTYAWLEENILENGCWSPLVLWNGILLDGHNRYEICMRHDIPFTTIDMEFDSRDAAMIWIISTQVARRNMTPFQLSHCRGLHYLAEKRIIKNESGRNQYSAEKEVRDHNDPKPNVLSTAERLGDHYRVSPATIKRDAQVATAITAIGVSSPDAMRRILSGDVSISKKQMRELAAGEVEDAADIAAKIDEGEFERGKAAKTAKAEEGGDLSNSDNTGLHPLRAEFFKNMDAFSSEMRKLFAGGSEEDLKSAFRSHMDRLEDLYGRL